MGLCPGSGSGELVVVGESEFSTGSGLCGAVIVNIDSYVSVEAVDKIENREFAYKEMRPL